MRRYEGHDKQTQSIKSCGLGGDHTTGKNQAHYQQGQTFSWSPNTTWRGFGRIHGEPIVGVHTVGPHLIESLGLGEHGVTLGCSDGQRLQSTRPDETQNHWNVDEKTIPVTRDHISDGERDPFIRSVIGVGFGCICEEFHRLVRQTADAAGTQRFAVF